MLGAGVSLECCGYFTSLCDVVEAVETASDAGSADQPETNDVEVDELSASARGQEIRRRAGRQTTNRRRPRTGNWRGSRGGHSADVRDDQEQALYSRGGTGPAGRRGRQYRGQWQRYRGQGQGRGVNFDTLGADDVQYWQQRHDGDGDGAYRGAEEGRRFYGQQRGGRYRRPNQVEREDSREVWQPDFGRGFRAQGRGGFRSSGPSHGRSYDPEQRRGTGQRSRAQGMPYHGKDTHGPGGSRYGSMESLDDAASTEGGYCKNRRVVDVPNEIGSEKCQVLLYHISDLKQFGCRIYINMKDHQVTVSGGSAEESQDTVELVYQKLVEMQSVKCSDISPSLAAALSGRKGMKWVRELFKEHKKPAAFYRHNDSVYVMAADEAMAREAIAVLSDQMGTADVPFAESQAAFLQSPSWQSFIASVQNNWIMTVEVLQSPRNVVRLVGVTSQLSDADSMVRSQLTEKSVSVEELEMSSGELRYLSVYRKDFRYKRITSEYARPLLLDCKSDLLC